MFTTLIKAITLITSLNIGWWQSSLYKQLTSKLTQPTFPYTTLTTTSDKSATFISYAAVKDPGDKYYFVIHDTVSMPTWLFLIRYNHKINDELWHRGFHNGVPCNIVRGDKLLFHLKTAGFIKTDIIFQIKYEIQNTKNGVVLYAIMDKSFPSDDVQEFNMIIWAFPHPIIKNLVIIVSQGYVKTSYDINMLDSHIKWHIDSILQNFGDRLTAVIK
jgi:hypothetical protein